MSQKSSSHIFYGRFLLFIAGLGGLLYGIDIGIVAAALLYVDKTISLSVSQTSLIVAAVLGGGTISSLAVGPLADWLGRRIMMISSGLLFVVSVGIIVLSQGFLSLFLGRVLQGMACGAIAVVVPLYLAECLSANFRGRGTALFQFALTFGIVVAAVTGFFYTRSAESAISAAAGNADLIRAAQDHAWRSMFLSVVWPGLLFFIGSFFLSESPRWLLRRGKTDKARTALLRSTSPEETEIELREMQIIADTCNQRSSFASLFSRKYIVPFLLACLVLSLNQTTGINSVLQYLVIILKQAGMTSSLATQGDVVVKVLNCVMTLLGVALVDRKGRKFLLNLGTGGIVIACLCGGIIFHQIESQRTNVLTTVQQAAANKTGFELPVNSTTLGPSINGRPMVLTVLYNAGEGDRVATVLSNDPDPRLKIHYENSISPVAPPVAGRKIEIKRAQYGPVPTENTGWLITACLCLFIASYACGPGVVVWLMLSELMPTRIRALGMGIALLLNQGISTLIAGVFLPVVGNYGYFAMFFFWSGCTVFYFLTSAFLLPETKGKSLEEIEMHFAKAKA